MKDMTSGNPIKHIVTFAIPMLIASIFQQLYTLVDTLIVSRFLGSEALAGVGSTGMITFLTLSLALGMGNGGGLIISQCFGSRNFIKLRETIVAMTWIMTVLTLVLSIFGYSFSETFLRALQVPDNVIGYSVAYIRIIFAFTGGMALFNWGSSILRSTGDSRTPLYALIIASFTNIALDLLFILKFGMGVRGAAAATVISQFISGFFCLFFIIRKRTELGFCGTATRGLLPKGHALYQVIRTSIPSVFQSCMISIGGISVQRLINSFGSDVIAGYTTANKVDSLAIQVILSVGNALSVFTGQNVGARRLDRVEEALKKSRVIMLISAVIIAVCAYTFRFDIMRMFVDANQPELVIKTGAEYLSIIGVAYLVCAVMQSYQNVIRGAGDVNTCMVAGLTELAGKIFFAYMLSPILGATGIWISTPLSWACGCVIPVVRYYSGKWRFKTLT